MNKASFAVLAAVCVSAFASCASVEHHKGPDASFGAGDYASALKQVTKQKGKGYRDKDAVLFDLDVGMLLHYSGDIEGSSKRLREAERGIERAFTKSVTQGVSSYLVNDSTKEYPGEDYEDIYLNVFNSLNFYRSGSLDGALVEIRRIDNKLKVLTTKYGVATSNAQRAALEKNKDVPFDASAHSTKFANSALARYLGMLFYRADGMYDDARIDRDQVRLAFANQKNVYAFPVPKSLDDELTVPRGMGRINVISFSGKGPIKTEKVDRIFLNGKNWIKIALPVITKRPSAVARIDVLLEDGRSFDLELIEDMAAVSAETFKVKAGFIYFKTILRSIAKTATSMALEKSAKKTKDSDGAFLLGLLSLGTQIYAEASEQADLRIARYFPGKAHVGGITVEPGTYSFTVRYFNGANRLIDSVRFDSVEVQPDRLSLSEAVCVK